MRKGWQGVESRESAMRRGREAKWEGGGIIEGRGEARKGNSGRKTTTAATDVIQFHRKREAKIADRMCEVHARDESVGRSSDRELEANLARTRTRSETPREFGSKLAREVRTQDQAERKNVLRAIREPNLDARRRLRGVDLKARAHARTAAGGAGAALATLALGALVRAPSLFPMPENGFAGGGTRRDVVVSRRAGISRGYTPAKSKISSKPPHENGITLMDHSTETLDSVAAPLF
ncbi:hypothetical protein B0H14DRAFT_2604097 [Mycena olivaceomarginata]|nr:hypothetical protein B0H14DRAFT_2604097 [Mycena olivaceomarginata]